MPNPKRLAGISLVAALAVATPCISRAETGEVTSGPKAEANEVKPPQNPAPPSAQASAKKPPLSTGRKALAVTASLFPGAIAHGTGHFVAGDPSTGLRLLAMEGIGFSMAAGGLAVLAATGASRRFAGPLAAVTASGVGLFLLSGLADIYGVAMPESARGSPAGAPYVETQLGARYVYDPTFAYRAFVGPSIDLRLGSFRLNPSAWFALDDVNARLRALAAYRPLGPVPGASTPGGARSRDGSFLDVETAVTHHRYGAFSAGALGTLGGYEITTVEASVHGRLDAHRLAESLRGSFFELGVGGAATIHNYQLTVEGNTLLLVRFAYGIYFGHPCGPGVASECSPSGEVKLYYDHRHDDYAAGLKVRGLGSGVPGHFGLMGSLFFTPSWGVGLDAQVGSAYIAGGSLIFRYGGSR